MSASEGRAPAGGAAIGGPRAARSPVRRIMLGSWLPAGLPVLFIGGACGLSLRPSLRPSSSAIRRGPSVVAPLAVSTKSASSGTSSPSSSASKSPFADFDYNARWYPVVWARDLLPNEPTKVTVFDVDYVVARVAVSGGANTGEVMALEDRCPHRAASLSEGRVTQTGHFQCAYHGWSFNGTDGSCVDIPQIAVAGGSNNNVAAVPSRSCAKAVPAQIHQEMVYLFIGGSLEEALLAPPPPTVPEYEAQGGNFQMSCSIREMPVDWPIVVSNICDFDHGLFAHQATPFDMYAASAEYPMEVVQEFPGNGRGWVMNTKVDAAEKLVKADRIRREERDGKATRKNKQKEKESPWATTKFEAPFHVQMRRLPKDSNATTFVSAFYVCPVGVGRTRFMAAGLSKKAPPRWLTKLLLDNFLDQDTYLLATQQHHILSQEAKDVRKMLKDAGSDDSALTALQSKAMPTRRRLFCLSSPTDVLGGKVEQFWDATLLRSPNRIVNLLKLDDAGAFLETPPRSVVLDRKKQHLDVCPDSQGAVRNCERVQTAGLAVAVGTVLANVLFRTVLSGTGAANTVNSTLLKPWIVAWAVGLSSLMYGIASKIRREYFFKYTDEYRRKDLSKIPKGIWMDR